MGNPDSAGVTQGTANDTLTAPFNDLEAVKTLVSANKGQIAAIILEPVVGNMGVVVGKTDFLQGLRTICDQEGIVLIFDEVMTGFRLDIGGFQNIIGIKPDMTTLGKIIGGGLPVGAYGGKKEIMQSISPVGKVYQAGTLSGNPIAVSAGLAMLRYLKEHPEVYQKINASTQELVSGMRAIHERLGVSYAINHIGSMYTLFFSSKDAIENFEDAKTSDTALFAQYFQGMLQEGVYLAPSQYESLFISTALDASHVAHILKAHEAVIARLQK
jgi:glutamate-1-semialdehyde 2,1-aminomutase